MSMAGITWTQLLIALGISLALTAVVFIVLVARDFRGDR
jgi:hypothetical protein